MAAKHQSTDPSGIGYEDIDLSDAIQVVGDDLRKQRILVIYGPINNTIASLIVQRLLTLDLASNEPIKLLISSDGGNDYDMWAIIDAMNWVKSPVNTYGIGLVASAGATIFVAGSKRFLFPHTQIMLHEGQASGEKGRTADHITFAKQYALESKIFIDFLCKVTGKKEDTITNALKTDKWFTAETAIKFGIADEIVTSRPASLKRRRRKQR